VVPACPERSRRRYSHGSSPKRPASAVVIDTYDGLSPYVQAFAGNRLNLLIIIGNAGLQKSRQVRAAIPGDSLWVEGHVTLFQLYIDLYNHRENGNMVVIDDADGLITSRDGVRLLKCLCQTEEKKIVAWHSSATKLEEQGIPKSFTTQNRVCIIANEWQTLDANVRALEDRGHLIWFKPFSVEVHQRVKMWFDDYEVYDFIGSHLDLLPFVSMRHYVNARELKIAGMDWKECLLHQWLPPKRYQVAKLKLDASFEKEEDRVRAFVDGGLGSRATYFRMSESLRGITPEKHCEPEDFLVSHTCSQESVSVPTM
jgi:hypothetical protein